LSFGRPPSINSNQTYHQARCKIHPKTIKQLSSRPHSRLSAPDLYTIFNVLVKYRTLSRQKRAGEPNVADGSGGFYHQAQETKCPLSLPLFAAQ
jgi:hypothetical protein